MLVCLNSCLNSCIFKEEEKITKEIELKNIHDTRKSFYKKAFVSFTNFNKKILRSYNSLVCIIDDHDNIYINYNIRNDLLFSNTTLRHIKEFIKQYSNHSNKHNYKIDDIKKFNNINIKEF